jgi:hypothetical protein
LPETNKSYRSGVEKEEIVIAHSIGDSNFRLPAPGKLLRYDEKDD